MLEAVLDIGLNDQSRIKLATYRGTKFALDTHICFIQNFGVAVLKVSAAELDKIVARISNGVSRSRLDTSQLEDILAEFKKHVYVPEEPLQQLVLAIQAMYASW
jgi:hypothetical protein